VLRIRFFRVLPENLPRLRFWMAELHRRRDEILETFASETVRQEAAYLLETGDGPLLAYVIEAEDLERAALAVEQDPKPIDHEHRRVMSEVLGEELFPELLLDERAE
jgi:hypothetical protein